jgi:drug/metabolite transporter (DMT)-like permease
VQQPLTQALTPVILALAWGLNWPAIKILLATVPPFTLRALGLGGGALLLLAIAIVRRRRLMPGAGDWKAVLIGGSLSIVAFNFCTAFAQLSTTTSRAAVLTYTMPMIAALLAWWLLGEKPQPRARWALLWGSLGILLLAWPVVQMLHAGLSAAGSSASATLAHPRVGSYAGLVFPLLAATAWAAGTVATKRWPPPGDRLVLTAWQLGLGALCGSLAAGLANEPWPSHWPALSLWALAFHTVIAMAMGYVLWFALLERATATVSALTTLAVPVVGVLGAMLLVGDRPSALDGLGFVAVMTAAALMMWPGAKKPTR